MPSLTTILGLSTGSSHGYSVNERQADSDGPSRGASCLVSGRVQRQHYNGHRKASANRDCDEDLAAQGGYSQGYGHHVGHTGGSAGWRVVLHRRRGAEPAGVRTRPCWHPGHVHRGTELDQRIASADLDGPRRGGGHVSGRADAVERCLRTDDCVSGEQLGHKAKSVGHRRLVLEQKASSDHGVQGDRRIRVVVVERPR